MPTDQVLKQFDIQEVEKAGGVKSPFVTDHPIL